MALVATKLREIHAQSSMSNGCVREHMTGECKKGKRRTNRRFSTQKNVAAFSDNFHLCVMMSRDTNVFEIDFDAQMVAATKEEQRNLQSWMQRHVRSELSLNMMIAFGSYYMYYSMCVVDMSEGGKEGVKRTSLSSPAEVRIAVSFNAFISHRDFQGQQCKKFPNFLNCLPNSLKRFQSF